MVAAAVMNCQIDTAKADYLLNAKNNQPTDIEQYVQDEKLRSSMKSRTKTEKGFGRKEQRTAYVTSDVSWQPDGREWPALACSGAIKSRFESKKGITEE